jgi:hypothetical protein
MTEPVIDINGELIPMPEGVEELTPDRDTPMGAAVPRPETLAATTAIRLGSKQGRDVSSYDPAVNWHALDFGINKRTEGSNFTSPGGASRKAAILGAGKVYSDYHYARPGDGARQADFFLAVAGMPAANHLPVWLDYEVSGLSPAFRDAFCNRYRHRVGVSPGLYTYLSMWRGQLGRRLGAASRLWLAHYGVSAPGEACDIWQHQGGPDLDTAYTTLSTMTVGANRRPPIVLRGPAGIYPYGPDPAHPYATGPLSGVRPTNSFAIRTYSGQTWSGIVRRYYPGTVMGQLTTDERALKQWHKTHGGKLEYTGYMNFGAGAIVVLPSSSPGHLAAA